MRGLLPFLAHRLFRALIALWLVSTVVFVVMRLSGDPVPLLLPPDAPTSEIMRVRRDLGLDRPLPVQYGVFLGNVLRGDFGRSIHFREPAFTVVRGYLAATLELGLTAFVLATLVALPIGLAVGDEAQLAPRPRRHGRGPRRPVRADLLPGHPVHPARCRSRPISSRPRAAATGRTSCCPR